MPARLSLRSPSVAVNAVLVIAIAAGGFWAYRSLSGPHAAEAAGTDTRTTPVEQGQVTKTVTADGSVASVSTASASFVTGGTVTAIEVKVGQKVAKGQTLAKVDPAAAQRTLDAAQADLDAARDALDRAQDADADTSSAENEVSQAELSVDEAQAGVDGTVLTAPMAGTVTAINGTIGSSSSGSGSASSPGSSSQGQSGQNGGQATRSTGGQTTSSSASTAGDGFIDLADLTKLQVTAPFAEADATKLKDNQPARITWNALSGTTATGKVTAIDPSATTSNNVVTYGVTVSMDKVPAGAKVGQTVSVVVTTGSVSNALFVNSAAVVSAGNLHFVTVMTNGQPVRRQVQIGLQGDSTTQITSGLQQGEQVQVVIAASTTGGGAAAGGGAFPGGAGGFRGAGGGARGAGAGAGGFGGAARGGR
jgi:macrolide-specific efflux system membrane fusion protein